MTNLINWSRSIGGLGGLEGALLGVCSLAVDVPFIKLWMTFSLCSR